MLLEFEDIQGLAQTSVGGSGDPSLALFFFFFIINKLYYYAFYALWQIIVIESTKSTSSVNQFIFIVN